MCAEMYSLRRKTFIAQLQLRLCRLCQFHFSPFRCVQREHTYSQTISGVDLYRIMPGRCRGRNRRSDLLGRGIECRRRACAATCWFFPFHTFYRPFPWEHALQRRFKNVLRDHLIHHGCQLKIGSPGLAKKTLSRLFDQRSALKDTAQCDRSTLASYARIPRIPRCHL